jgi:endoglucanase
MNQNLTSRRHALVSLSAAAAAGVLGACSTARSDPEPSLDELYPLMPAGPAPGASSRMRSLNASLGRGINFGNMLDAPSEGEWGLRASDEFIELVGGDKGFTRSVRLPVRWSNHAGADAAAIIDPVFFARVDAVMDKLLARGVTVILNMHHYRQLDGDPLDTDLSVPPAVLKARFLAMWRQIGERYAGRSENQLIFELYNEPHGRLEPAWNDLASRALRAVRRSNPTRAVVIGPTRWNSVDALPQLLLPNDPNLILTVHSYEPFEFTHQGATWVKPMKPVGQDCCSPGQLSQMNAVLDKAVRESARLGYPCFVGEFGAYSSAPDAARLRYARALRDSMESRGLPWFWWELAAGFGVYDPAAHRFRDGLMGALYR